MSVDEKQTRAVCEAANWDWPDWVPVDVRDVVERDWSVDARFGLDPAQRWRDNARNNRAPELGTRVSASLLLNGRVRALGRYVHCWNNIGRVITDRGAAVAVCCDGWEAMPVLVMS